MILMKREEKHHNYKQNQRQSKFFINKKEKNKIGKIEDCQMKQNKMHNKPETKTCQERR